MGLNHDWRTELWVLNFYNHVKLFASVQNYWGIIYLCNTGPIPTGLSLRSYGTSHIWLLFQRDWKDHPEQSSSVSTHKVLRNENTVDSPLPTIRHLYNDLGTEGFLCKPVGTAIFSLTILFWCPTVCYLSTSSIRWILNLYKFYHKVNYYLSWFIYDDPFYSVICIFPQKQAY